MRFEDSRHGDNFVGRYSSSLLPADHFKPRINIIKMKVKVLTPRKRWQPSLACSVELANSAQRDQNDLEAK